MIRLLATRRPQSPLSYPNLQLPIGRYTPAYDVWVLAWTWMQMIIGERWCDWKELRKDEDDKLGQLLKPYFYEKTLQAAGEGFWAGIGRILPLFGIEDLG